MSTRAQLILVGLVCFLVGCLVTPHLAFVHAQEAPKGPKWTHGLDLKVRKGGEAEFSKDTKKIGIEVFRDENNNNLIYVSDTGSIAVIAGK
jgi:hypothetical protein